FFFLVLFCFHFTFSLVFFWLPSARVYRAYEARSSSEQRRTVCTCTQKSLNACLTPICPTTTTTSAIAAAAAAAAGTPQCSLIGSATPRCVQQRTLEGVHHTATATGASAAGEASDCTPGVAFFWFLSFAL
ncbi:hypothetical protein DQ04_25761000, partial [Trypanosoma grayi]|uniref:hypothetical protein n=1 Tax=Trypanosoma grayi TaxID=71804 RepID=UPI0004F47D7E